MEEDRLAETFLGVEQGPFLCHPLSPVYTPVTAVDSGVPIFKLQVYAHVPSWGSGPMEDGSLFHFYYPKFLVQCCTCRMFSADVLTVMVGDWISMSMTFSGLFTA